MAIRGYLVAMRTTPSRRSASAARSSPATLGQHHPAAAVAEVDELVDLALGLLHEHVLAGDADVRGAGLDVGGHVGGPHGDDADVLEQQLAVVVAHLAGVEAEPVQEVERLAEQRPARDGDPQRSPHRWPHYARPLSSPVSAMCTRSTLSAKPTAGSGRPNDASSSS